MTPIAPDITAFLRVRLPVERRASAHTSDTYAYAFSSSSSSPASGLTTSFGTIAPKVALGVALRHDWGSQYTANTFVNEIKCWGFTDTPAFIGEPECNGCAKRFMRTLKEQCLYLDQFRDLEEARQIIGAFIARYNAEWIVERLGYRTPAQARRDALQEAA